MAPCYPVDVTDAAPEQAIQSTAKQPAPPIVLYDGVCGLCHRAVRFLLRADRHKRLTFAPLQGDTAARLRQQHPEIPQDLDSVVLIDNDQVILRSKVFMVGSRHLPYPWRVMYWFRWIPLWMTDPVYRLVARFRYRLFGKLESCALPSPDQRERFLP